MKTERENIIWNSRNREKDLLEMIHTELNKLEDQPKKIIINENAYSILLKYLEYKAEPINTIRDIPVKVLSDKTIDYFKFE